MSNKLEKELDKLCKKEDSNSCEKIKEATLLLEVPKENLAILQQINLDYQLEKNKKIVDMKNKVESLNTLYARKTMTGKELKELCNLYDLKLYFAESYKGKLCSNLSTELIEFEKDTKEHLRSRNCFILSTEKSFRSPNDLNDNCIFLFREGENTKNASENDVFTVIHSWGENIKDNRKYNFLFSGQIIMALAFIFISLVFNNSMIFSSLLLLGAIFMILEKCLCETSDDLLWNSLEKE